MGYVVKLLEAALWAFYRSESFREGCLLAVNLGDDADTTGAVYGQLAGAYYGAAQIPIEWREKLAKYLELTSVKRAMRCGQFESGQPRSTSIAHFGMKIQWHVP